MKSFFFNALLFYFICKILVFYLFIERSCREIGTKLLFLKFYILIIFCFLNKIVSSYVCLLCVFPTTFSLDVGLLKEVSGFAFKISFCLNSEFLIFYDIKVLNLLSKEDCLDLIIDANTSLLEC